MMNLREKYKKEAVPAMMKKFGYKNLMAVPKLEKVVVNTGIGKIKDEQKEAIEKQLTMIVGQKVSERAAKKSIATFKIRKGDSIIGFSATLRGKRMYDFLDRMISAAIPRKRDFRGMNSGSADKSGNFTVGFKEHIVFPEMIDEDVKSIFGFEATIVTTAETEEEVLELLKLLGLPFAKK